MLNIILIIDFPFQAKMLASCSICDDYITGIHPESVCTTPCGHVFHHECLMTWIQRYYCSLNSVIP